jgi:hypothetical protein
MAPSKRARAVSAAGREIERALGLAKSTDVLSRWMAYRLAEVRGAVEHATDPTARKAAQAEQDSLIVALWAKRPSLPVALGIDLRLGTAVTLIEALLGKQEQWHRAPPRPHEPQEIVEAMRDAMQQMVTSAAVLLSTREVLATGPEDSDLPLNKNERVARERLAQLSSMIMRRVSAAAGHKRDVLPPDEESLALLEKDINGKIDAIIGLLNAFRQVVIKRQSATNDRATGKRKAMPSKAAQRRKENKSKPA